MINLMSWQLDIPHDYYTAEEFDAWIANEVAVTRAMLLAGGFFKPSQSVEVSHSFTVFGDSGILNVELDASDVKISSRSMMHYIDVNDLRRKVIENGHTGLKITYTCPPPAWSTKGKTYTFEAYIPVGLFEKQDSITITMMEENRGSRYVWVPNPDTKWGRFFSEVK